MPSNELPATTLSLAFHPHVPENGRRTLVHAAHVLPVDHERPPRGKPWDWRSAGRATTRDNAPGSDDEQPRAAARNTDDTRPRRRTASDAQRPSSPPPRSYDPARGDRWAVAGDDRPTLRRRPPARG